MDSLISLTGIKPTGEPHIGNYFGAICPALKLSKNSNNKAYYFIADYHAMNTLIDKKQIMEYTLSVAATWLACGLDPNKVLFYRQSDVPQIFELATILMNFTAKGRMNGAHAYKSVVQKNVEQNKDPDKAINMGLFSYPVLMTADILIFNASHVPIGKDQVQHLEICNDIAGAFNHHYQTEVFTKPKPIYSETTQTIIGTDGQKMSKSYDNTIPLFLPSKALQKKVMSIKTNSQRLEEPKDPDKCHIFSLYRLLSDNNEQETLAKRYRKGGMGWGEAKQILYEKLESLLAPKRKIYNDYINRPAELLKILQQGGEKAREIASKNMQNIRQIIGIDLI